MAAIHKVKNKKGLLFIKLKTKKAVLFKHTLTNLISLCKI